MNIIHLFFRNIQKKKLLTTLRILSLVIGGSIALYIFQYNAQQESYDDFWNNGDKLYRVTLKEERNGEEVAHAAKCFGGAPLLFRNEIPGVENGVFFGKDVITVFCNENQFNDVNWLWSDTTIFDVLERKILYSENENIWGDVHGVAISESFAKKIFGEANAVNKRLKLNEGWEFFVSAVFEDIPENSHLAIDVVGAYQSVRYYMQNFDNTTGVLVDNPERMPGALSAYGGWLWRQPAHMRNYCYIKLADNSSIKDVEEQIPAALEKVTLAPNMSEARLSFILQPINSIHLKSDIIQEFKNNGSQKRVNFLYLIAIVVLVVSAINFINLTSMQTIESGKHYAIRLLNGASVKSIVRYLLFENTLVGLVSFALVVLLIVLLSQQLGIHMIPSLKSVLFVVSVLLITGFLAGITGYFSALHGKFKQYLKSQTGSLAGNWSGRKLLVIMQFSISIILIAGVLLINKQLNYMMDSDLGFSPEYRVFSYSPMSMNQRPDIPSKMHTFKNRVKALPGVNSFCTSSSIPGKEIGKSVTDVRMGKDAEVIAENFSILSMTDEFTQLYDVKMLAGREFNVQANWRSDEVMVNALAAQKLGFESPSEIVGKVISYQGRNRTVVGVIANYHHESLKKEIQPLICEQNLSWNHGVGYYSILLSSKNMDHTIAQIRDIWEEVYPEETATFHFADNNFESQYAAEKKFRQILSLGSFMAIMISCMGLFALALFDTRKRIREIGIRKVNGAKIGQIMVLLNKDLLKWIVASLVVAVPVSYFMLTSWLNDFAYKTSISWWIFALAGAITMMIALFTVSWQSLKAAMKNPVKALRYE